MSERHNRKAELAARALQWAGRPQEFICDRIDPWEHGTAYRASRYPHYFDLNIVRVQDQSGMSVEALIENAWSSATRTALSPTGPR